MATIFNQTQFLNDVDKNTTPFTLVAQVLFVLLMMLVTITGNVAVIYIIRKSKKLHNVGMYLIASLAFCDALVGFLVMPMKGAFQLATQWPFNRLMCDMWTFVDVTFCTASIMHLCAIGLDRLWIFTYELSYMVKRTYKVAIFLVTLVWLLSVLVALPLIVYPWADKSDDECNIPSNIGYTLYSTIAAFYLPFLLLIVIYMRMYAIAKRKWREKAARASSATTTPLCAGHTNGGWKKISDKQIEPCSGPSSPLGPLEDSEKMGNKKFEDSKLLQLKERTSDSGSDKADKSGNGQVQLTIYDTETVSRVRGRLVRWKKRANEKKERKAITTLFAILFSFTVCWLPFFVLALLVPFCGPSCDPGNHAHLFIDWLGYFNSTLNPIIYALMNDDLRQAYRAMRRKIN